MIKNRLYILFFTSLFFSVSLITSFAFDDLKDVTIQDFHAANSSFKYLKESESINNSSDVALYCVKVVEKDLTSGELKSEFYFCSKKPVIEYDGHLGTSKLIWPSGTFYINSMVSSANYVFDEDVVFNYNNTKVFFDGYVVPNYDDSSVNYLEGELVPPGENQETPLGVIGDISYLAWFVNLLIKSLMGLLVLLLCYLILPTLLKKLLNYFLDF